MYLKLAKKINKKLKIQRRHWPTALTARLKECQEPPTTPLITGCWHLFPCRKCFSGGLLKTNLSSNPNIRADLWHKLIVHCDRFLFYSCCKRRERQSNSINSPSRSLSPSLSLELESLGWQCCIYACLGLNLWGTILNAPASPFQGAGLEEPARVRHST